MSQFNTKAVSYVSYFLLNAIIIFTIFYWLYLNFLWNLSFKFQLKNRYKQSKETKISLCLSVCLFICPSVFLKFGSFLYAFFFFFLALHSFLFPLRMQIFLFNIQNHLDSQCFDYLSKMSQSYLTYFRFSSF